MRTIWKFLRAPCFFPPIVRQGRIQLQDPDPLRVGLLPAVQLQQQRHAVVPVRRRIRPQEDGPVDEREARPRLPLLVADERGQGQEVRIERPADLIALARPNMLIDDPES